MEKVFKGCRCPQGKADVDSAQCRSCGHYVRDLGTFIVCSCPAQEKANEKEQSIASVTPKKATKKPASTKQKAKGKAKQTKTANKAKKRGRPRKAK